MTALAKYSMEEFVHDMGRLVGEQPDQEGLFDRGSSYLERLTNDPKALPEEYRLPAVSRAGAPTTAPSSSITGPTA